MDKISTELAKSITNVAPIVWDTMLQVKRIDSIGIILGALIAVVISLIGAWLAHKKAIALVEKYGADCEEAGPSTAWAICIALSWAGPVIAAAAIIFWLFNIWTWVGVFSPGLAIAYDIISRIVTK